MERLQPELYHEAKFREAKARRVLKSWLEELTSPPKQLSVEATAMGSVRPYLSGSVAARGACMCDVSMVGFSISLMVRLDHYSHRAHYPLRGVSAIFSVTHMHVYSTHIARMHGRRWGCPLCRSSIHSSSLGGGGPHGCIIFCARARARGRGERGGLTAHIVGRSRTCKALNLTRPTASFSAIAMYCDRESNPT